MSTMTNTWAAAAVALAARRVASFGTWVVRWKTRALSGALRRRITADRAPEGRFSDNGPSGRGGDQAEDRALHEQDRARHGGKPVGQAGTSGRR